MNLKIDHIVLFCWKLWYERLTNWANLNYEMTQKMNSQSIIKANKTYYLLRFTLIEVSLNFCPYEVGYIEMVALSLKLEWSCNCQFIFQQEYIPVGCVLPASAAVSTGGVCLWIQRYLPLGRGVSATPPPTHPPFTTTTPLLNRMTDRQV